MDSCVQWHNTVLLPLSRLAKGARGVVSAVLTDESDGGGVGAAIARRLLEIGFVAGERIEIVGKIWPGGDPVAVRVGSSIFALRRREAQAVMVHVEAM
jgi:ferrous iron transport protein A